jgi:hypothetical protein
VPDIEVEPAAAAQHFRNPRPALVVAWVLGSAAFVGAAIVLERLPGLRRYLLRDRLGDEEPRPRS